MAAASTIESTIRRRLNTKISAFMRRLTSLGFLSLGKMRWLSTLAAAGISKACREMAP